MISVTELRAGTTFLLNSHPHQVLKYSHVKLGRSKANVKVKVKDLKTGAVFKKTFISGAKVEPVAIQKKKMQYLYQEGGLFYFMDPQNFEQISIEEKILGDQSQFLKEGKEINILFWRAEPLLVELPASLAFRVAKTSPGVRGDSATNIFKGAILASGKKIKVPLFIKEGDWVRVDTRSGEYLERVKVKK